MYVTVSHKLLRDHAENRRTTYCVVGKKYETEEIKERRQPRPQALFGKRRYGGETRGARDDGLEALRETPGRSFVQNGGQNIID